MTSFSEDRQAAYATGVEPTLHPARSERRLFGDERDVISEHDRKAFGAELYLKMRRCLPTVEEESV